MCLTFDKQVQYPASFGFSQLKVDSFREIPMGYIGSCMCRPNSNSQILLDSITEFILKHDSIVFALECHTDARGNEVSNHEMSGIRARITVSYLIEKGVSTDQIQPKAFGESEPWIATKLDAEKYRFLEVGDILTTEFINKLEEDQQEICHSLNRRTILRITEIKN